jgi:hypothetical protein
MRRHRTNRTEKITSATAMDIVAELSRFSTAADLHKTARHTEAEGFVYAAAMQWRKAAGLFDSEELTDACWREWERIMHLSRRFAAAL